MKEGSKCKIMGEDERKKESNKNERYRREVEKRGREREGRSNERDDEKMRLGKRNVDERERERR